MQTARWFSAASIGLIFGLCGCYHYAYPPVGAPYGGGPGMYPAAPSGGFAPSMYPAAPDGSYMTPQTTPYVPSGPSPTPLPNGGAPSGQPTWQQPGSSSSSGGSNPAPTYDNPVPNPTDEETKTFGETPAASRMPSGAPAAGNLSSSGVQLQPIEINPTYPAGALPAATSLAENEDPFESPMRPTSGGSSLPARSASLGNTESRPNPFAYDAKNFAWLRGIVDFDSQDQRWVIIYSADPDSTDRYGGSITLSDHPLLQRIKPGDVVLVEGTVDESSFDHHGKPIYKIGKLQPLKPKT